MLIIKSKKIAGVKYQKLNLSVDHKGIRVITYNWLDLFQAGEEDIFEMIYTKRCTSSPCVVEGLYSIPQQKILLRCFQGCMNLFLADLRNNSETFLKTERLKLRSSWSMDSNLYQGGLIPEGVVWGVEQAEPNSILLIQTSRPVDFAQVQMINPLDEQLGTLFDGIEFSVIDAFSREMKTVQEFLDLRAQDNRVDELTGRLSEVLERN
ncbi:dTDP-4-dehydrorhamnose 3,5-epimerase family protein [Pyramidobacter sp. YE332]|uniref:dTDP-4-dehydrorhamnose 3,5-epimerase family protein n=1 Tax=Pyramidobacter sp. YE332 TaxID=3068894 RepID=UPI00294B004B|nr:dTDP-4-dehydrorhamnose 3,5-epimerase family protein [Pyramidobacter sp. YE332]WOL38948.1 dTDP-4-dehydrorhamnose 3,5-epimerase family protein [Pyramidobacter sp. YE332]